MNVFFNLLARLFGPRLIPYVPYVPAPVTPVTPVIPAPPVVQVSVKSLPNGSQTVVSASIQHGVGIRVDHLTGMGVSQANALKHVGYLNEACERFEINNHARICAFISQICEESGMLSVTEENLHYSAQRMHEVWPGKFPTADAAQYAVNGGPEGIADAVYGGRLGNDMHGDGYKYRGRGFIQLTFKANYEASSHGCGADLVTNPDLVALPEYAALTAAEYWKRNGCNEMSDPDNMDAVTRVTKKINGGYINLPARQANWKKAEIVFADLTIKGDSHYV